MDLLILLGLGIVIGMLANLSPTTTLKSKGNQPSKYVPAPKNPPHNKENI